MTWQRLRVTVDAADAARAEAVLAVLGAAAVSFSDAGDTPLLEPSPAATPLWPSVEVEALFPDTIDLGPVAALLARHFPDAPIDFDVVAERDWQRALAEPIAPRVFGRRLAIAGADAPPGPSDRTLVRLNLGFAFGTGRHPTTRLCLEWLDAELAPGATVLDYGCGSGVLALAALALGAAHASAVDDDPQALTAARANAALNGAAERIWIGLPEELPERRFDVIVANILAGTLVALAPRFAALASPGARLVLSGVLEPQARDVEAAYARWFGDFEHAVEDGWVRIAARRLPEPTG